MEAALPFAMAAGWRWRGSEVPGQKTGFATVAAACSVVAVMPAGPPDWLSIAVGSACFWAAWRAGIAQPWPRTLDMGRTDGTAAGDIAAHSVAAVGMIAPPTGIAAAWLGDAAHAAGASLPHAALAALPAFVLLAAAALAGPLYALGWRLVDRWPALRDPTRLGDLLTGFALGAALAAIGWLR